jgi:hypothetical protein
MIWDQIIAIMATFAAPVESGAESQLGRFRFAD